MTAAREYSDPRFFSDETVALFWERVAIGEAGECWPWKARRSARGYGSFYANGSFAIASRYALFLVNDRGLGRWERACHTCDNPPCCNPAHLWIGSPRDNALDMVAKGRESRILPTHCIHGHAFSGKNIIFLKRGGRACRECGRIRDARARIKKRLKPPHSADGHGPTRSTPGVVGPFNHEGSDA